MSRLSCWLNRNPEPRILRERVRRNKEFRVLRRSYHVHVNMEPHKDDYDFHPAKRFPCHYQTKMPPEWKGDSGCKYNVNRMFEQENCHGGTVDFGTCSEFRLALYLLWLRLCGYRKDDDRDWTT